MPEPAPREPRRDDTAADAASLELMGRLPEQPSPQWSGLFLEPPPLPEPEE
ncbi:hypothetical protein STRTUCAR8_08537 [Streptomyces turgidiscabies Car8]|uniref:Uncharacterized protein n=1 Tax=Streptomyces turgidiscabies (strain Car8) TaxID=698760 RepID=L7F7S1_STRT8|nr:hypothetical protein [Streptomyces turgidiscabies]ELP67628.1 hypothetical protein STRTUCAR8_08537 [Streptomyces turgidiscabies Car8]